MATVGQNGLFPPRIDSYLPAIIYNKNETLSEPLIQIPIDLTEFNDLDQIRNVQFTITRQSNYKSIFNKQIYPTGIGFINLPGGAEDGASSRNYVIQVDNNSIVFSGSDCQLNYNEYYKIQVRVSEEKVPAGTTGIALSQWYNDNLEHFSEWSTVGLIRFISPYSLNLKINNTVGDSTNINIITIPSVELVGSFPKAITTDKENVSQYQVIIQQEIENEYAEQYKSAVLRTTDNTLNYQIPLYFEYNVRYKIIINVTTDHLNNQSFEYIVRNDTTEESWGSQEDVLMDLFVDSVVGKVNINFDPQLEGGLPQGSVFIIRRASNLDGYQYWDTIWKKTLSEVTQNIFYFEDYTIESGTLYKYNIIYTNTSSTSYSVTTSEVMSIFDTAFLTGEGTQLSVKFNPNISNFKINKSDNIVTTIGSQYPFITRNGNMNYKTFSLSGTIAYEMDNQHRFASRASIYGQEIDIYGTYFVNHYINQMNDQITQRKFRQLVLNYLCDDVPKLFRSTPEGNILVRITDVNITPNQQLSRMICDFNCTVTEIGEANIDNYKLYKIQDFGDLI